MKTLSYPFRIRGSTKNSRMKAVKVTANGFKNALNKVLALYPAKFVLTKHARKMDLISAKVEAAKESRVQKVPIYVTVDKEGECHISNKPSISPENTMAEFRNGKEVKIEVEQKIVEAVNNEAAPTKISKEGKSKPANKTVSPTKKEVTLKTEKKMSTTAKTKKKTVAAKKTIPAKKAIAASKPAGKGKTMSIKSIIALVSKGKKAFNKDMKPLPLAYLKKFADPNKEILATITEGA